MSKVEFGLIVRDVSHGRPAESQWLGDGVGPRHPWLELWAVSGTDMGVKGLTPPWPSLYPLCNLRQLRVDTPQASHEW